MINTDFIDKWIELDEGDRDTYIFLRNWTKGKITSIHSLTPYYTIGDDTCMAPPRTASEQRDKDKILNIINTMINDTDYLVEIPYNNWNDDLICDGVNHVNEPYSDMLTDTNDIRNSQSIMYQSTTHQSSSVTNFCEDCIKKFGEDNTESNDIKKIDTQEDRPECLGCENWAVYQKTSSNTYDLCEKCYAMQSNTDYKKIVFLKGPIKKPVWPDNTQLSVDCSTYYRIEYLLEDSRYVLNYAESCCNHSDLIMNAVESKELITALQKSIDIKIPFTYEQICEIWDKPPSWVTQETLDNSVI